MKKAILIALVGAAASLVAQEGTSWTAIHLGQTQFDTAAIPGNNNLKSKFHWGGGMGHWYSDSWGVDLRALTHDLEGKIPGSGKSQEAHVLASALFNLDLGAKNWWPYAAVGAGSSTVGSGYSESRQMTTRLNYHVGLGIMGTLTEGMLVDLSGKMVSVEQLKSRTEYLVTLGLGYTWGGRKAAPAPVAAPAPAPKPAPVAPPPPAPKPAPVVAPPPPPPPAPAPAPAPAPKPVPPPPPPAKIVLDEAVLHFANDKADLGPEAVAAIQKVAASLKGFTGNYTMEVSGHTSSVGGKAHNKDLAKRRADAVAKVLLDSGVAVGRLTTVGIGPDKPIADNATKEGQAKNRRVEIELKLNGGKAEVRKNQTGTVDAPAPAAKKPAKKAAQKPAAK